jgi:hypothetical protein
MTDVVIKRRSKQKSPIIPICQLCGKPIYDQLSNSKVHAACKNEWDYIRKKAQAEQIASSWKFERPCRWCETTFIPKNKHQVTCSDKKCVQKQKYAAELLRRAGKGRRTTGGEGMGATVEFSIPCPWEMGYLSTLPWGVKTWDCPEMDPMSAGTARVKLVMENVSIARAA